jgi:hypothetical protein
MSSCGAPKTAFVSPIRSIGPPNNEHVGLVVPATAAAKVVAKTIPRVTVAPVPICAAGTDCADAGQPLSLHRREGYERTPWMTLGMSSPKIILSDARAS